MLTQILQYTGFATYFAFALLCLAVYRATPGAAMPHRRAWLLIGGAFTAHGVSMGTQLVFGTLAFVRGPESATWDSYLRWSPALNHGRTFLLLAVFGVLGVAMLLPRAGRARRLNAAAAVAGAVGLAAGSVLGWQEERLREATHYAAVARWDIVDLIVLLSVLLIALVTAQMDRLLWFALTIYAFTLALNVLWFAAFSWFGVSGQWAPKGWEIHLYRTVLNLGMVVVVARRLHLARRKVPVRALMEPSRPVLGIPA